MRRKFTVGGLLSEWRTLFTKHFAFFGVSKLAIICWPIAAGVAFCNGLPILALIFIGISSFIFVIYDYYLASYVKEKLVDGRHPCDPMQ